MPAADELYLLSQKSSDLCDNLISQFQKYFDWLDEVILSAKESRGKALIPKTPGRKKNKNVFEDVENVAPLLPPPLPPVENVRKSSRAAAKAAHEKTKKTIQEISNIGSKIRRPSSPLEIKPEKSINVLDEKSETVENSGVANKPIVILELELPEISNFKDDDRLEDKNNFEKLDYGKNNSIFSSDDKIDVRILSLNVDPPLVEELTKQKNHKIHQQDDDKHDDSPLVEELTKQKNEELIYINPKIHQQDDDKHEFTKPTRVTRTKKRIAETADTAIPVQPEVLIRSTRSKRRKLEEEEISQKEEVVESRGPVLKDEQLISNQLSCTSTLSDIQPILVIPPKVVNNEASITQPSENVPIRVTRSKVRKLNPTTSPQKEIIDHCSPKQFIPIKTSSNRNALTLKAKIESPILLKNSDSPQKKLKTKKLNNLKTSKTTLMHNASIDRNEIYSSPLVVKHFVSANPKSGTSTFPRTKNSNQTPPISSSTAKSGTSTFPRTKNSNQTPSPISSSTAKMLGMKQSIFGSAGFQSTYQQKRKPIICSSPQIGGKAIGTPTESSRVRNIVMGSSFLTKVLPNKPTKEETEEKRKEEIRRKREREEEIRIKREEMLKWQREEKKRKNEERVRKVQETRELKEKKEAELREMLEKERKQKEERLKDEKRRKQLELKKIEELKLRKQAIEEQRLFEEQKAREELRKLEEKKKFEDKKLLEKREAERLAREKLELEKKREEERIAREKEEMELLKMKEARNTPESEKINETYTTSTEHPLNTTYSKPAQKSEENQSYEMTPVAEKKNPKSNTAEDYGIADLRSDDSTDDECAPKKKIPSWARGSPLRKQLLYQELYPPDLDDLFPPSQLLQMPDLSKIFIKQRSRFLKRTSSAVWNTPPYKL